MKQKDEAMMDGDSGISRESNSELVMPFIVCQSKGGLFDDAAFVAGFEVGRIWETLESCKYLEYLEVTVHAENLPQLDLVAMHFGFTMSKNQDFGDWASVTFSKNTD